MEHGAIDGVNVPLHVRPPYTLNTSAIDGVGAVLRVQHLGSEDDLFSKQVTAAISPLLRYCILTI